MRNLAWKIHYNKKKHEKMNMKTKIIIFLCHVCAYTLHSKYFIYDIERFFQNFICDLYPCGTNSFYIFQKKQNTGKCASCVQIINPNVKKFFLWDLHMFIKIFNLSHNVIWINPEELIARELGYYSSSRKFATNIRVFHVIGTMKIGNIFMNISKINYF